MPLWLPLKTSQRCRCFFYYVYNVTGMIVNLIFQHANKTDVIRAIFCIIATLFTKPTCRETRKYEVLVKWVTPMQSSNRDVWQVFEVSATISHFAHKCNFLQLSQDKRNFLQISQNKCNICNFPSESQQGGATMLSWLPTACLFEENLNCN